MREQDGSVTGHDSSDDGSRRVVLFRPRAGRYQRVVQAEAPDGGCPVSDLGKYERPPGPDNYRQRMLVNVLAFAFTVVLAVVGIWIAETMAVMRKNQDCVLTGRRGCTPVDVKAMNRGAGGVSGQER
jgi:hypothetical protein